MLISTEQSNTRSQSQTCTFFLNLPLLPGESNGTITYSISRFPLLGQVWHPLISKSTSDTLNLPNLPSILPILISIISHLDYFIHAPNK